MTVFYEHPVVEPSLAPQLHREHATLVKHRKYINQEQPKMAKYLTRTHQDISRHQDQKTEHHGMTRHDHDEKSGNDHNTYHKVRRKQEDLWPGNDKKAGNQSRVYRYRLQGIPPSVVCNTPIPRLRSG